MAFKYPLLLKYRAQDILLFAQRPGCGLVLACGYEPRYINSWVTGWNRDESAWAVPTQLEVDRIMTKMRLGKYVYKSDPFVVSYG